jgi:hypothetical protein
MVGYELCATLGERAHHPDLILLDSSPFHRPSEPDSDREIRDRILAMLGPRPDPQTRQRVDETFAAHVEALANFETERRYDGRVLLLICTGESDLVERERAVRRWRALAPKLEIDTVDADHYGVFEPEHVPQLSGAIAKFLGMPPEVTG